MPIVPLKPILQNAVEKGYAQGAFNVNAVAQAKAVIDIHETFRSAAILQGADLANAFMGGRADFMNGTLEDKKKGAANIAEAVRKFGDESPIPIALHLDHGKEFDAVKAAIDAGYSSVMIDGSHLPYAENVELTREVVKYAHEQGVSVEGELGVLAGIEDDVFSEESTYTNPLTVVDFYKKTGIDFLALSFGTKHGAAKGKDVRLRKEIVIASMENLKHEGIDGILVSHGSSTVPRYIVNEINALGGDIQNAWGIPLGELREIIPYGIGKINIDTDIRLAVTRNVREMFVGEPKLQSSSSIGPVWEIMAAKADQFDPRVYLPPVMDTVLSGVCPDDDVARLMERVEAGVREVVGTLIVQFGSVGHAPECELTTLEEMAERYRKAGL